MIVYPAALPMPQTSIVSPVERRRLSDPSRPREAGPAERDQRKVEQISFPPMSVEQYAVFRAWWRDDLILGGAWFAADWPLPHGIVTAVRRFIGAPRWSFVAGGLWRITAQCEVRGLSLLPEQGGGGGEESGIGWFDPINDPWYGDPAHGNNGTRDLADWLGGITSLAAGVIDWSGEEVEWSIASWSSPDVHAAPVLEDIGNGRVLIHWQNWGGEEMPVPPLNDPSIGALVLTATVDGEPIAAGQRLVAVSSPAVGDYPLIAWGPEP